MTNKTIELSNALYEYLLEVSLREPEVLQRLRFETARDSMARMQISPDQGQFMALLVRLMGARNALEIGVYTGYSTLCVALALPREGHIVACDISDEWTAIARRYWTEAGVESKIDLRLAPALQTLEELLVAGEANSFDFAFIDADKENYGAYYEHVLRLLRPGGLIVVDNVLWSGRVLEANTQDKDTLAIRHFNARLSYDERVHLSLVPIADGLMLALKRAETSL